MVKSNTTGGVLMKKTSRLSLIALILFCLLGSWRQCVFAQDQIPHRPSLERPLKRVLEVHEMGWMADTVSLPPFTFPSAFKGTATNEISDSISLLSPVFEHLRQVRAGLATDTVRIVHIGDSHIRGHIFPQTTDSLMRKAFGSVCYTDMGVNGATCLTFTHPKRVADIAELKPELLILSFGTNESHNRRYDANVHYHQMDELIGLLQESMPGIPILLTTPPGSYESFRQRRKKRTYKINPRTVTAVETIRKYAEEHHLLVWDMYNVVGGEERACLNWTEAGLMRPDHVHYLPEGYTLQGNLLYQAIVQAYNKYVITR